MSDDQLFAVIEQAGVPRDIGRTVLLALRAAGFEVVKTDDLKRMKSAAEAVLAALEDQKPFER